MIELLIILIPSTALFFYVVYWSANWIAMARHKNATESQSTPISVIVCAHNELENLKQLIPLLIDQDYPNFELIIVDDRSDDDTYDYFLENKIEKLKYVRVDAVHSHINAKKYAITLGVKAAKNDMLLFTDADCRPVSRNWISSMSRPMNESVNFVIGVSPYLSEPGLLNHFIRFETLLTAVNYFGFALMGNPYMAVGRNLAYRKSFFMKNNGFNKFQIVTGGDDDLLINQFANKKNTQVCIEKESFIHSVPKKTWGEYFYQKIRHISVSKHYRHSDKIILGLQSLSNLLFWVSLVILATQTELYAIPVGLVLFRWIFMAILLYNTSKKIGDRINVWLVPVLDFMYLFFVTVVGTKAIFTKKVKWKK